MREALLGLISDTEKVYELAILVSAVFDPLQPLRSGIVLAPEPAAGDLEPAAAAKRNLQSVQFKVMAGKAETPPRKGWDWPFFTVPGTGRPSCSSEIRNQPI